MRAWQAIVVVVAVAVVMAEAQNVRRPGNRPRHRPRPGVRPRIPSRAELTVAVNNLDTVKKALECIEGPQCQLDEEYGIMLRNWGPDIMMNGGCPDILCSKEEAREAKWLMAKIFEKYPGRYMGTLNRLIKRTELYNPYSG